MTKSSNKFVVAKKDIVAPQEIMVEKGDIGVIKSEDRNHASIFFIRIWRQVELSINDFEVVAVRKTGDGFSKKICNVCHKLKKLMNLQKIRTQKTIGQ